MTMLRTRKRQKTYTTYLANNQSKACEFCALGDGDSQFIAATPHFKIVKNIFSYDMWDSCGIEEQIMLLPKKHYVSLSEFTPAELQEYAAQLATFDKQGYSIYLRAPTAVTKSVIHQHTHFIKLDNKRKKLVVYLKKPHFLWFR